MTDKFFKIACAAIALMSTDLTAKLLPQQNNNCPPPPPPPPCECLWPGEPMVKFQCPAAYNIPANYDLADRCDRWGWVTGFYIDVSYTYWMAEQEGMSIASNGIFDATATPVADIVVFANETFELFQPTQFQSGFKIGAGWRWEDWDLSGEYTYVRNTTQLGTTLAPAASPASLGTGVWFVNPWFQQISVPGGQSLAGTAIASKWHLGVDIADFSLSRPYYQGPRVIVTPFGGIRAMWLRQTMEVDLTQITGDETSLPAQPLVSTNESDSWALGPRMGSEAWWLLPWYGLRLQGNFAASILFTRYTDLTHSEPAASTTFPVTTVNESYGEYNTVRPVLECGLGLGWGSYLFCHKYHLDLSADYDFTYLWNQNMMRTMLSDFWDGIPANYDLHLHGLTVKARFDF